MESLRRKKKAETFQLLLNPWSSRQGAGVLWTPLCAAQKRRPRRQPRTGVRWTPLCAAQKRRPRRQPRRGCPVDTSVRSAEAPTEAAAENLNLLFPMNIDSLPILSNCGILPLAVPKIAFRLGAPSDFDRCAISPSLHRPPDALRAQCPKQARLLCSQEQKKQQPFSYCLIYGRGDRT